MGVKENVKVLKGVDDAWNTGNWKKVWTAHTKDVIASGPHLPAATKGLDAHRKDIEGLITAFPDMKSTTTMAFGQGDWVAAEGVRRESTPATQGSWRRRPLYVDCEVPRWSSRATRSIAC